MGTDHLTFVTCQEGTCLSEATCTHGSIHSYVVCGKIVSQTEPKILNIVMSTSTITCRTVERSWDGSPKKCRNKDQGSTYIFLV